jgi:hypothetical protein
MQVADLTVEVLRAQINEAFSDVGIPGYEELLLAPYKDNEDACEMAAAFRDKFWSNLPLKTLDYNREMLFALSAAGYRAYLPAYLMASLSEDPATVGELGGHMLDGLRAWPTSSEVRIATTRERLSLLDPRQRSVIGHVLQYLATKWDMKRAGEILADWE